MLKKLKEKLSKKKIITIGIAIIAIITTIVAILLNQTETQTKKKKIIADSELARAMTYDQFNDGDDSIDGTNNVKFSAFFLRDVNNDGYAEKIKGTCKLREHVRRLEKRILFTWKLMYRLRVC